MSFVEKNKAWLLPILGVGVASVLFMNYRSFKPSIPDPVVQAAPATLATPAEAMATPILDPGTAAKTGTDLWADLKNLAEPPREYKAASELRTRCQRNLDELLDPHFPAELPRPGPVREATPLPAPASAVSHPAAPSALQASTQPTAAAVPELSFILSGPDGLSAWYHGRPYRRGQTLPGGSYRVTALTWDQVTLAGPDGQALVQSTNPPSPVAGSRPTVEVP